jgi:predicted nucleotide-binding protein (sugar kinase/HSP70/actin superfamily)
VDDSDLKHRFHLMQTEIEATASLLKDAKIDLTSALGSIKIELEILKTYMERYHPDFAKSYAALREEAIQAIDPEWLGNEPTRKQ